MFFFVNPSTDPAFNLALEYHFLCEKKEEFVFLWRNASAVVIGRNQDARAEIDRAVLTRRGISLVRRISGGGAVYHDLGNINYSVVTGYREGAFEDFRSFCQPVLGYLKTLGLQAETGGRNDLLLDGAKFSGTAQAVQNGRILSHGTLLFDTDLSLLSQVLTPDPDKLRSKGIRSVKSRVANLRPQLKNDCTPAEFLDGLAAYFLTERDAYTLTDADLSAAEDWKNRRFGEAAWIWGTDLSDADKKAVCRFPGGRLTAVWQECGGRFSRLRLYGDFFGLRDAQPLEEAFEGQPCTEAAVRAICQNHGLSDYVSGLDADTLCRALFPAENKAV